MSDSDAWSDIQAIKSKQSSLRAKMLQRRKEREEIAAEITKSSISPTISSEGETPLSVSHWNCPFCNWKLAHKIADPYIFFSIVVNVDLIAIFTPLLEVSWIWVCSRAITFTPIHVGAHSRSRPFTFAPSTFALKVRSHPTRWRPIFIGIVLYNLESSLGIKVHEVYCYLSIFFSLFLHIVRFW